MTRIAELQKRYPSLHKDVIVKWEVMTKGIRDSRDLDKMSSWRQVSQGSYLSYDEELTLDRLRKETPWRVKDDAVLVPDTVWMRSGLGFRPDRKERSPYTINETSGGRFALFEGEEMVDLEVYASPPKRRWPKQVTSKGTPVQDLVEAFRSPCCYRILPVRFCEYFNDGEQCKFCNFNPLQESRRNLGVNRPATINPEETAEAFKIIGSDTRLYEGVLESGGFKRSDTEASVNSRFVEKLCSAVPYRTHMKLAAEAMPRKELLRLRDAGLVAIKLQMELFDERLFPLINPGKAKHLSRDGWLEAFQDAVDIFGVGNVAAKFVGGVALQGPHGFCTWQEARDSHMEGDRWMIGHGVFPTMQALRWAPGSEFSQDPANRDKFAPTEYFLDLIVAHDRAMKEYGLYDKLNRFLCCGLHNQEVNYGGEQGILEKAGDYGTWMMEVVPFEQNWLAQFLDSVAGDGKKGRE